MLRIKQISKPKLNLRLLNAGSVNFLTLCLLSISILSLSACGFHLRSYAESVSSIKELSLDCPNTSSWELCHHLKQTLLLNGILITDNAPLQLTISSMIQNSRVLSLQPNASAAELDLISEVSYSITSTTDNAIKHEQTVDIKNSYRHDSSALLAKERERDELQLQLSKQLAEEIVRQITILDSDEWLKSSGSDSLVLSPSQPGNQ